MCHHEVQEVFGLLLQNISIIRGYVNFVETGNRKLIILVSSSSKYCLNDDSKPMSARPTNAQNS